MISFSPRLRERLRIALSLYFLALFPLAFMFLPESLDMIGGRVLAAQLQWLLFELPASALAALVAVMVSLPSAPRPSLVSYALVVVLEFLVCYLLAGTALTPPEGSGIMESADHRDSSV